MWLLLAMSMFLAYFFPQLLGHGRYWYLNTSLSGSFLLFIVKLILRVIDEYLCEVAGTKVGLQRGRWVHLVFVCSIKQCIADLSLRSQEVEIILTIHSPS